ncbi:MAG: carbohydrate binding domain-containing protein [Solirubrobacterales bacterium]
MCDKSLRLILVALGLVLAPAAHAQVVNMALNGSFEEDEVILNDPAWTEWATWGDQAGLNSTVELDNTEFVDGARSLRIVPKGDTNWYFIVLNLPIPMVVGRTYTASFWAKAEAPRPLTVQFKDTANKPVTWGQTAFQLTTDWTEYSMTSASQDASMKLEFFCSGSEVPFWLDFVWVYEGAYTAGINPSSIAGSDKARDPAPADQTTDVPHDVVLSWTPGKDAQTRNVYLGTDPAEVNDADTVNPTAALVSEGQTATTYAPADLQYGETYYWRVDEINAAPDSTVRKGDVWRFTVEPYAYPIETVTAAASGSQPGMGAQNTVNGSGLDDLDQHSTQPTHMWMTNGAKPAWIQFEFDRTYKLHELWVWNSNQLVESFMGFGAKDVTIQYSADGETWTALEGVPEFGQANGLPTYTANTTVDFGGVMAKFVKLTIDSNWGGLAPQTGLSEVRFFYVPLQAFDPQPADAAAGVPIDGELSWRPGREASSHVVYLGTDADAVAAGTVPGETVTDHSYAPADLLLGAEYFWKVDEVGDAGTVAGDVWSFTTQPYAVVDDFESYTDDVEAKATIWHAWIDGLTNGKSGSQVGYDAAPFAERTVVHGGRQAMPLKYGNSSFAFSEATRTFDSPQDWTTRGIKTLSIHFAGAAGNSGRLYARIGNVKVAYDGDAANLALDTWQKWDIDLSAAGNVGSVDSLTIGIEGSGATGMLYIDDIQIYP